MPAGPDTPCDAVPGRAASTAADPLGAPAATAPPATADPDPVTPAAAAAIPDADAGVSEAGAAVAPSMTSATSAGQNEVGVAVTTGAARVIMAPRAASSGRSFGSLA